MRGPGYGAAQAAGLSTAPEAPETRQLIVSVASGKGGTGKTLVATSMALSLSAAGRSEAVQFLDCDVEEPNGHLFLKPTLTSSESVRIPIPLVDDAKCTYCGRCSEVCAFNAIAVIREKVLVFPELCHGCGACTYFCPETAISETGKEAGVVETGRAGPVLFVHGKLNIGEAMAPAVIREVKRRVDPRCAVVIDVPPGTSCPVVESVRGSDFCLLVTEPTPFGLNDLVLAVEVTRKLAIPCGVVLNRTGVGDDAVEEYCRREHVPLLLTIPLDTRIAEEYARGVPLVEAMPEWRERFVQLFDTMNEMTERGAAEAGQARA